MDNEWACAVLGVPASSSLETAKQAYRRLLLHCHPDKNIHTQEDPEEALKTLLRVQRAWEVLRESERVSSLSGRETVAATCEEVSFARFERSSSTYSDLFRYQCRCGDFYEVERIFFFTKVHTLYTVNVHWFL